MIEYGNVVWPPAELDGPRQFWRQWGAWYSGDPDQLLQVYGAGGGMVPDWRYTNGQSGYLAQPRSTGMAGIVNSVQRWFWGRQPGATQSTSRLHVPAASDIAALSADLLFGEPPAFTIGEGGDGAGSGAQERLEDILDYGGVYSTLLEGAELCSAYGGVYLRACVDATVADMPMLDTLPVDVGVPEWRYGRLTAVTFWRVVHEDGDKVFRHLERHEVVGNVGMVYHALYVGSADKLGMAWPLDAHSETARFAPLVDANGGIVTGASKLDVAFVPNVRPHRKIRGTPHGRSDFAGAEPAMDGLDEAWSSLMRDVRIGKGRIVVPSGYLKSGGRGGGSSFDLEQEVFQSVETMGDPTKAMSLSDVQFAIRVVEHLGVCSGHWRTIMRTAGLSADAFGEEIDGGAATAKEVGKRGERTAATRSRKIGYWRPALAHMAAVLLELDAAHFAGKLPTDPVEVEWPDAGAMDPETQARTLQLLDQAGAVSTATKVSTLHPDWSEQQIAVEVDLIDGGPVANPDQFDPTAGVVDMFRAPSAPAP